MTHFLFLSNSPINRTMKSDGETALSDQSLKPRRPKSREVSSRFLSPISMSPAEIGIPSPNHTLSPLRQKPRSSADGRKHRSLEESGIMRGLWPSSATKTTKSSSEKKLGTLAEHLGNERLKDLIVDRESYANSENSMFINRQRSFTEFNRFEKSDQPSGKIAKENHKPIFGGSMRYTGKLRFPGQSSTSSVSTSSNRSQPSSDDIVPGRFSVYGNALRRRSFSRRSDSFSDTQDSESDSNDLCSNTSFGSPIIGKNSTASYMAPTASSRKSGMEVPSKYMHDSSTKTRRRTSDSNLPNPLSSDNSPKFTTKNAMKRANSISTYGKREKSKWALSPGRSGSPPMSVENKGKTMSFSSLKPPTSPSRTKGVGNFLSMGLDLFRSKKSSANTGSSPLGPGGAAESVHQLRLMHNRLLQWRYANTRTDAVNGNIANQAKNNLIYSWNTLTKLQHSVLQRKLQLEKEKLEMKLNSILHSQIKLLEGWGDMERQHLSAISMTKDCLHSVICRVPLVEGAKMEPQTASVAFRRASDLATSIKSMLYSFSQPVDQTVSVVSELAEIVAQERILLEELAELFRTISPSEIQEMSLKCSIIQMKLWEQQQPQRHKQQEIAS